jgi:hypothetical protein
MRPVQHESRVAEDATRAHKQQLLSDRIVSA